MASDIRCIYSEEPNFPATAQHPDAVRYHVGNRFVDAIGGQPTQAEIDAVLTPPPKPHSAAAMLSRQRVQAGDDLDIEIAALPPSQQKAFTLIKQLLQKD